jgi:hypothetical protein
MHETFLFPWKSNMQLCFFVEYSGLQGCDALASCPTLRPTRQIFSNIAVKTSNLACLFTGEAKAAKHL